MSERPGTMIYFDDLLPLFDILRDEEIGLLFKSVVMYGKFGEVPTFSNAPALAIAWGFIRPKIDRDGKKYNQEIFQRRYAVYCRETKKHGNDPVPFDEWYREISADTPRYPTATATATGTANVSEIETVPENSPSTGAGGGTEKETVASPPPPLSQAERYFREKINPDPSASSMEKLREFEAELGPEVCLRAVDEAMNAGKRTWNYLAAILLRKQEQGIRSLEDWDRAEAQRMARKTTQAAGEETEAGFRGPSYIGDNEAVFRELEALGVDLSGED